MSYSCPSFVLTTHIIIYSNTLCTQITSLCVIHGIKEKMVCNACMHFNAISIQIYLIVSFFALYILTHHLSSSLLPLLIFIHNALRLHHHSLKYTQYQIKRWCAMSTFFFMPNKFKYNYVIGSIFVYPHHSCHLSTSQLS